MARFNIKADLKAGEVENLGGGVAYEQTPELEVASLILTSLVQDQHYRTEDETIAKLRYLLDQAEPPLDPEFVAKAAIYARDKYGLRSITHVVAAEIIQRVKGPKSVPKGQTPPELWTRRFLKAVVVRVDDVAEIFSYWATKYGTDKNGKTRAIPNAMKDGLGDALGKFDEYQLAKYRGANKNTKLVDLVNLLHPKPQAGRNAKGLSDLVADRLRNERTWEKQLSDAGKAEATDTKTKEEVRAEAKAEAWRVQVESGKMPYMSLLMNLRNISTAGDEIVDKAAALLVDPKAIAKSRILPFQFDAAHEALMGAGTTAGRKLTVALEDAIDIAVLENVPVFPGTTCVIFDVSGSMDAATRGGKGVQMTNKRVASLFAAAMAKRNNSDIILFTDAGQIGYGYENNNKATKAEDEAGAKYVSYSPTESVAMLAKRLTQMSVGNHGTNFNLPFKIMTRGYDRLVFFSDMQGWGGDEHEPVGSWGYYGGSPVGAMNVWAAKYNNGNRPIIYSFDLAGYGSMMFPAKDTYAIAGFSLKVFDLMSALETDRDAMVNAIKNVTF